MTSKKKRDPRGRHKRLDGVEWRQAEMMWASGEYTQKQIAEKFGINQQTVFNRMRKHGIEKGSDRDRFHEVAERNLRQETEEELKGLMKESFESKKITVRGSLAIQRLIMGALKRARDENRSVASVQAEIKTLMDAQKALGEGWRNVATSLGLDKGEADEDSLPELVVHEITQIDIDEIQQQHKEQEAIMNGTADDIVEDPDLDDMIDEEDDLVDEEGMDE